MDENGNLQGWAHGVIGEQIDTASEALASYCKHPHSAKHLHRARKGLAHLRAALQDLGTLAGATPEFFDRINELHRRAGKVRDADVLLARIDEYHSDAAAPECKELAVLRASLRRRRKRARRKLQRAVSDLPDLRS